MFKLTKDTGFETKQQRQRNSVFDENVPASKKPHQRSSPKVRNRKRWSQSEHNSYSATGKNLKGIIVQV